MSNGGANFRIIKDARAADPGDARNVLRNDNTRLDSLLGLNMYFTEGALEIPDDGALLMIGNTKELLDACAEASRNVGRIATTNRSSLIVHFVRMKISAFQNDTLIVIGSQQYWNSVRAPAATWTELDEQVTTLSLYDDTSQNNLRRWIQSIKDNYGDPTVDKEGRPL
jgi:hypothetical protein